METLLKRAESTKSSWLLFILGILVTLLVGWLLYAKKRTLLRKEVLENKVKTQREKADNAKDKETSDRHLEQANIHARKAAELDSAIEELDAKAHDAKTRIDSARSIDELAEL